MNKGPDIQEIIKFMRERMKAATPGRWNSWAGPSLPAEVAVWFGFEVQGTLADLNNVLWPIAEEGTPTNEQGIPKKYVGYFTNVHDQTFVELAKLWLPKILDELERANAVAAAAFEELKFTYSHPMAADRGEVCTEQADVPKLYKALKVWQDFKE